MSAFTGTRRLVRLALRRDRISLPVTILLVIAMVAGSAPALSSAYPDYETQFDYISASAPSVVGRIFQGTVQGVNLGSIMMAETFMFSAVILAIMSIFIVSRHTRYNEETGAGELIGSTHVGRSAPLTAALFVAVGANLLAALLIFLSLSSVPELGTGGSAMLSLSLSMIGIFFAGVAAITVQLSDYRRGANGLAIGALSAFFLIRALGDATGELSADALSVSANWMTWLSPIGWGYQTLPYTSNNVLPLALLALGFITTAGFGYYLLGKRDIGSSIFESKAGLARAKTKLLSAVGLARRLHKPSFLGWSAGFVIFGGMIAVIANDFRETFEENEQFQEFLAIEGGSGSFSKTIIAAMFPLLAAMLAGYVVSALSKMQDEETSGRIEYLLGTALGRIKWMFSHVGLTSLGVVVNLGLMGLAGGLGYALASDVSDVSTVDVVLASLFSVPAMLLFMSIIVLIFAASGRFVKVFAWSFYGYCALIGSFASIFTWPQMTLNVSPFSHTPSYPADNVNIAPLIAMLVISLLLLAVSTLLFKRRDISLK